MSTGRGVMGSRGVICTTCRSPSSDVIITTGLPRRAGIMCTQREPAGLQVRAHARVCSARVPLEYVGDGGEDEYVAGGGPLVDGVAVLPDVRTRHKLLDQHLLFALAQRCVFAAPPQDMLASCVSCRVSCVPTSWTGPG